MKNESILRNLFSKHIISIAFILVLIYQIFDMILNYFVSGELQKGFSNFYQSRGGKEDLLRFFVLLFLFLFFGKFCGKIIQEHREVQEDQLRHMNELKNFANAVIHDAKNPAIGIYTMAMLLRKKYDEIIDHQGKHYLDIMEQTSKDIVKLMELVNMFIRSRECKLSIETVNVQNEIDIIQESLSQILETRKIEWHQTPKIFPQIRGDRLSIHRIFRNLIDNSIKYGGNDLNRIIVEYQETDEFHIFYVCDNGSGIDELDQENIFEIFSRAKTSGKVEGLGLGLAIVKELVVKHNGTIKLTSSLGKGTAFVFTISRNL